MNTVKLHITAMAFGGRGIGKHDGKVYFVDDAIEGDEVIAEVTKNSKNFSEARTIELITPSKNRVEPKCRYAHKCGGCPWISMSYPSQLHWKKQSIISSLKKMPNIKILPELNIHTHTPEEYRNRVMLRGRIGIDGSIRLGYFKKRSRDFIAVKDCLIADPSIRSFIKGLENINLGAHKHEISFRVEIQTHPGIGNQLSLIFIPATRNPCQNLKNAVNKLKAPNVEWIGFNNERQKSPFLRWDHWRNLDFYSRPGSFQQVNIALNHKVRDHIRALCEDISPSNILDVFCGSGNLSLAVSGLSANLTGVEFDPIAIDNAKHSVKANSLKQTEFYADDAKKFLLKEVKKNNEYDLIILDPPRAGFYEGLEAMLMLNPKDIIYMSCDPVTLARDLEVLVKNGFEISKFDAFDFFPQTYHIESVVWLNRACSPSSSPASEASVGDLSDFS